MAAAVKILEGLKILVKYHPDAETDAQHDVLYAAGPRPEKLDEVDRQEMTNLGWTYDIQVDSWKRFT